MQLAKSSTFEPLPMPWIERLFSRLHGFYAAKFAEQWKGADIGTVKALWAEELGGYSAAEIAAGLDGCRKRDWPPTLPEFLKLCRPPVNHTMLWYEAQSAARERDQGKVGTWSAPWVFAAFREMAFEVRAGEFGKYGERWRFELERAKVAFDRGEIAAEIPVPAKALPEPEKLNRDEAKQRVAALGIKLPTARRGTEWAEALLQRVANGAKLPIAHIDMAKRALGLDKPAPAEVEQE